MGIGGARWAVAGAWLLVAGPALAATTVCAPIAAIQPQEGIKSVFGRAVAKQLKELGQQEGAQLLGARMVPFELANDQVAKLKLACAKLPQVPATLDGHVFHEGSNHVFSVEGPFSWEQEDWVIVHDRVAGSGELLRETVAVKGKLQPVDEPAED